MKEIKITDFKRHPPYLSNLYGTNPIPIPINDNATFDVINNPPMFSWRMVMGSSLVRLDILGSGNILGSVPDFPWYWVPRNVLTNGGSRYNAIWNGTTSNGSHLPAGNYQLLYRALKIFGDANNNSDYEEWISPPFNIEYGTVVNISSSTATTPTTTTGSGAHTALTYSVQLYFFLVVMCFFRL